MEIKAQVFRDGTSQRRRSLRSLDPSFISVEERTLADWIRFAQTYAQSLRYFDSQNQVAGDWAGFFAGDAEAIAAAVEALAAGSDWEAEAAKAALPAAMLNLIAQPHLALFLTFLKLLQYPQQQFQALTQRRLDFYYRQVLRLTAKAAVPDQTHVVFSLSPGESAYWLPQGTRLSAGTDSEGNDLHYATDADLYLTPAQVASVKTLSVEKVSIDLEVIHQAGDRSHAAFANMLRWAIGSPSQGDPLPPLPPSDPLAPDDDTFSAILALFAEIQDYTLEQVSAARQQYILHQLCFASLDDFQFCLGVHSREIGKQRGEADVVPPSDLEWQQVYRLVKKAYRKKINRDRRLQLKQTHQSQLDPEVAFLELWRQALGDPAAGDPLPPFPAQQEADLSALQADTSDAAARYIQDQLFLSVADFQKIMDIHRRLGADWDNPEWEEVYRLLERAQTRKRGFTYPPIGRTEVRSICASAVATAAPEQPLTLPRFQPFIAAPLCACDSVQALGVAITSPVLQLQAGHRQITLTLACEAQTFNRDRLTELLAQGDRPFSVAISSAAGWLPVEPVQFAVGDFFLETPLSTYPQAAWAAIYQSAEADFAQGRDGGQYLRFADGSLYQIEAVASPNRVQLRLVGVVGLGEAVDQYPGLDLGGDGTVLSNLQLSDDRRELLDSRNRFSPEDVGSFVIWSDGVIFQIAEFANAGRVGIHEWGYLPGTGEIRKTAQIAFAAAPIARFTDMTPVGMALTAAADEAARLLPRDIGTLVAWASGDIYKLVGLVSDREATVIPIGRIGRSPTPDTPIEQYSAAGIYLSSLQFSFTLEATQPAITAPPAAEALSAFQTPYPVVKLLLQADTAETAYYPIFKDLRLEKASVQVAVQGVQDLQIRSDRAVLSPKSPFEPFGAQPVAGASFYFSHPEIIAKKLDSLSLKLEWLGLPDSFATHYHAYANAGLTSQPPVIDNHSFQARLELLLNRTWQPLGTRSLFESPPAGAAAVLSSTATLHYDPASFAAIPTAGLWQVIKEPASNDLLDHDRYFRLELTRPDFQHALYPLVLNKVALATDPATKALTAYAPYTPKVKAISLDYRASAEIDLSAASETASGQLFQLHPFGYLDLQQAEDKTCLPQYDGEGSLLIGLRDAQPPQQLTLFFQLVSGSGNADLAQPEIQWSYLTGDRWQPLQQADILSDSTHGLVDSGILHLALPKAMTAQNQRLPSGLYWLRAAVSHNALAIPDILDIRTQAVTATFVDQDNDPAHLSQPLAADAVEALVERIPAIARVSQPYSSFGGRRQETSSAFYTRASERLRHKQRALTTWDYERLVLEQFPQIYKVKCLSQAEQSHVPSAARVTVVVIPNIANTAPFLPLEPKAPQYLLQAIAAYLQAHTSPFVQVAVKNPRYEQIKYRVAVRFRAAYEQGYYLKQLNQELVRFLSPWAYEEQSDISFGSSIHSSAVIHFIESRPYVDYVANLKLIEQVELARDRSAARPTYQVNPSNLAQVKQVDSILVSAPEHIIDLITTADYAAEEFEGIDYMIVGLDFMVT
ncbi:MAG: hypothetical protein F6K04_07685 [Leptolyngbya sp. SIO4C5]|nr:hypothetical protein [Leptolyngbya sp. SIO4C5]